LTKNETDALFKLLNEIFTICLRSASEAYLKAKSKQNNKKKKEDEKIDDSIELNFLGADNEKLDPDDLFNMSGTDYSAHSETFLDRTTGNASFENEKRINCLNYFLTNYEEPAKQNILLNKSKKVSAETNLQKCLLKYYTPEDHEKFADVLAKIRRTLCKLDSAGLTFYHIFTSSKNHHYNLFKQFLVNLEVWGSYKGLSLDENGIYNLQSAKKAIEVHLMATIESLMDIFKEPGIENYPFLKLLAEKTGSVGYFYSLIANKMLKYVFL
jgi:hypothetical protein